MQESLQAAAAKAQAAQAQQQLQTLQAENRALMTTLSQGTKVSMDAIKPVLVSFRAANLNALGCR